MRHRAAGQRTHEGIAARPQCASRRVGSAVNQSFQTRQCESPDCLTSPRNPSAAGLVLAERIAMAMRIGGMKLTRGLVDHGPDVSCASLNQVFRRARDIAD